MTVNRVQVVENIMNANDQVAQINRQTLDKAGAFSINLMASPGAGKTSFILKTIEAMQPEYKMAWLKAILPL